MSADSLYENALADARKLREVAEQDAKNRIIDAITPKIRDYIEKELTESLDVEDDEDEEVLNDEEAVKESVELTEDAALTLDKLTFEEKYVDPVASLNESYNSILKEKNKSVRGEKLRQLIATIENVAEGVRPQDKNKLLELNSKVASFYGKVTLENLTESNDKIKEFVKNARVLTSAKKTNGAKVAFMRACVQNIKESINLFNKVKSVDENSILLKSLNESVKEMWKMAKQNGKIINEAELMLKLGLPDDIELDPSAVTASVVGADEEGVEGGDVSLGGEDVGGELGGGEMPDVDGGGDGVEGAADVVPDEEVTEGEECETEVCEVDSLDEIADLRDDDVIEISESALRRELTKLRALREGEETKVPEGGKTGGATDPDVMEDFGGGKAEGEPFLDGKVTTETRFLRNKLIKNNAAARRLQTENAALKKELAKYRSLVESARKKLLEQNLFNTKLMYVNKVLTNGDLSKTQKFKIIESLDSARTDREVKLLYKGLSSAQTDAGSAGKKLTESAGRVVGSASKVTKPASTITESVETNRWALLAGIDKK